MIAVPKLHLLSIVRALTTWGLHRGPPFPPVYSTMPQVHPFFTDRHVSFVRPLYISFFRWNPSYSYPWYFLSFLFLDIAYHFDVFFFWSDIAAVWVLLYSSSLLILNCQNILRILYRGMHLVWKVFSFWVMVFVTFRDLEP